VHEGENRMKSNKIFVILAGISGLVGIIVEVGFDMDNVYDMTTTALFVLIVVFAFMGVFLSGRSKPIEDAKKNLK
jgi:Ca2+/Na+ antiporter